MIRLSRAQVREVDRIAIEEYGILGIVLMQSAAQSAVDAIVARYGSPKDKDVLILCGNGNNGGDGFVIARLLHELGARVVLHRVDTSKPLSPDAAFHALLAPKFSTPTIDPRYIFDFKNWWLTIDAIFGTGLTTPPRDAEKSLLQEINRPDRTIVAVDLPSGLDCDTGLPIGDVCVKAAITVTFVAEKLGFANPLSKQYTGEVVVGDIGCPREIINRVLREAPARSDEHPK